MNDNLLNYFENFLSKTIKTEAQLFTFMEEKDIKKKFSDSERTLLAELWLAENSEGEFVFEASKYLDADYEEEMEAKEDEEWEDEDYADEEE